MSIRAVPTLKLAAICQNPNHLNIAPGIPLSQPQNPVLFQKSSRYRIDVRQYSQQDIVNQEALFQPIHSQSSQMKSMFPGNQKGIQQGTAHQVHSSIIATGSKAYGKYLLHSKISKRKGNARAMYGRSCHPTETKEKEQRETYGHSATSKTLG